MLPLLGLTGGFERCGDGVALDFGWHIGAMRED